MLRILIIIGIAFGFFLLLRVLMLWYWKINKILEALTDIKDLLETSKKVTTP